MLCRAGQHQDPLVVDQGTALSNKQSLLRTSMLSHSQALVSTSTLPHSGTVCSVESTCCLPSA